MNAGSPEDQTGHPPTHTHTDTHTHTHPARALSKALKHSTMGVKRS